MPTFGVQRAAVEEKIDKWLLKYKWLWLPFYAFWFGIKSFFSWILGRK